MDKRYQVFVSSTFEDLQEERKEVMQALLELDCIPAGMELFPASNDDQWTLIKRVIDDSDYYILIIGGRYGSTNDEGKSYTQMEYEYAVKIGKPVIAFLHQNPDNIPSGKSEQDPENKKKLEKFKEITKKKLVKYWEGADNLGSVVSRSMINLIKNNPAEGWIRANSAVDEKSVSEIARLMQENEELKSLLKRVSFEAPKGTENLAQGEDEIVVDFSFEGLEFSGIGIGYESIEYDSCIRFSWNEIFSCIAPLMIDECAEDRMIQCLSEYIEKNHDWKKEEELSDLSNTHYYKISINSFNTIIVQLRALGLIALGTKTRKVSDNQTYWKLTPYGDNVMSQIIAIKK